MSKVTQQGPQAMLEGQELDTYLRIVQNTLPASGSLYALVDTRHQPLHERFAQWNVSQYRSLWDTLITPDCRDIAPYLLHIATLDQLAQDHPACSGAQARIAQLLAASKDAPMLTWLWSDKPFDDLYRHLQAWVECRTTDRQSVLMHFYDTRILPVWLSVLTPEQKQAFSGIASEWWYADREGQLHIIKTEGPVAFDDLPLTLTNRQEKELLNANVADSILSDIASIAPELTEEKPYSTLHRQADALLKKAYAYRVDKYSEHVQFVMLGLIYDPDFDLHDSLQPYWEKLKTGDIAFADVVQQVHEVWQ